MSCTDKLYKSVSSVELMTQRSADLFGTLRFDRKKPKVLIGKKLKTKKRTGQDQMSLSCANEKTKKAGLPLPTCINLKWLI